MLCRNQYLIRNNKNNNQFSEYVGDNTGMVYPLEDNETKETEAPVTW